jgi:hypothetical protein
MHPGAPAFDGVANGIAAIVSPTSNTPVACNARRIRIRISSLSALGEMAVGSDACCPAY